METKSKKNIQFKKFLVIGVTISTICATIYGLLKQLAEQNELKIFLLYSENKLLYILLPITGFIMISILSRLLLRKD